MQHFSMVEGVEREGGRERAEQEKGREGESRAGGSREGGREGGRERALFCSFLLSLYNS